MINLIITGDKEVTRGLNNMISAISTNPSLMLDNAARETQSKMRSEAPMATGRLKSSINIDRPDKFVRIISPSVDWGYYQETRHKERQKRPPISKIYQWAQAKGLADAESVAFVIARKIERAGYPSNPFVLRTYRWVQTQIIKHIEPFLNNIAVSYMRG